MVACGGAAPTDANDAGLDLPEVPILLSDELGFSGALAMDDACIYYTTGTELRCASYGTDSTQTLATFEPMNTITIALDQGFVYGASLPLDFGPTGDRSLQIWRVPMQGGAVQPLASRTSGFGAGEGLAVGNEVYFTTGGSADLWGVPKDGGDVALLASDSGNFGDLAVDGDTLYYINGITVYAQDVNSRERAGEPFTGGVGDSSIIATHDSDLILFGGSFGLGDSTLASVPLSEGGEPTTIATFSGNATGMDLVARTAYLAIGEIGIVAVDLDSGAENVIVQEDSPIRVVANASVVAWSRFGGELWILGL